MHPRELSILDFTYLLPDERIARYPLEERDSSKLLVYKNGAISESRYTKLADFIPENSFLVFNNTKVIEARLLFQKDNGSRIEIFCLEPHPSYKDITSGMLQKGTVYWKCLVGGAKKWKQGLLHAEFTSEGERKLFLTAEKKEQVGDGYWIEFRWDDPSLSFAEILHIAGAVPLPPYLNRQVEESDKERYQTIYAKWDGSVAAPTAGLHFTEKVFADLAAKKIETGFVTLHVGAGTFKPVKADKMEGHEMHSEFIDVDQDFIEALLTKTNDTVIAVGTTSLRTLESLFWIGAKLLKNPALMPDQLPVSQWEPYDNEVQNITAEKALESILEWMKKSNTRKLITKTQIIIAPGYAFKVARALVTNFHQPQSTLLLLVAAITGNEWKNIYRYAMENDFRFLSYGDGSLLWI